VGMQQPTLEVAQRLVEHIEDDGSIARLAVPVSSLDPEGVRFWVEHVVGDAALADAITERGDSVEALLALRHQQATAVLLGSAC